MIKSNHSNALPIDAAVTARQLRAWCGNPVDPILSQSSNLNEDDPDGRQSHGRPLQPADRLAQDQHGERAAKDDTALAQWRDQADRPLNIGPHAAQIGRQQQGRPRIAELAWLLRTVNGFVRSTPDTNPN